MLAHPRPGRNGKDEKRKVKQKTARGGNDWEGHNRPPTCICRKCHGLLSHWGSISPQHTHAVVLLMTRAPSQGHNFADPPKTEDEKILETKDRGGNDWEGHNRLEAIWPKNSRWGNISMILGKKAPASERERERETQRERESRLYLGRKSFETEFC